MAYSAVFADSIAKGDTNKTLKIPKGYSEFVNQKRTDIKMAKREKKIKWQTTIYKPLYRQLKIGLH